MTLLNLNQEKTPMFNVKKGRYKLTCIFNNHFHIKFVLKNEMREINLTQNIYSDAGIYKFVLNFPFDGQLYLYQSLDRQNSWTEGEFNIVEVL